MFESIKAWLRKHRKGVIITASIIGIVGGVVILIINGKKTKMPIAEVVEKLVPEKPSTLTSSTSTVTIEVDGVLKTFPRSTFIRQLHEGYQPSAAKVAQAESMGIPLASGQTIVDPCIVRMRVA